MKQIFSIALLILPFSVLAQSTNSQRSSVETSKRAIRTDVIQVPGSRRLFF